MPRIDDRGAPDPSIERMMQERQKDEAKKQTRQEFEKKFVTQKTSVEQSKSAAASNATIGKEVIKKSQDSEAQRLAAKSSGSETRAAQKGVTREAPAKANQPSERAGKTHDKKVDEKRETKKEEAKTAKAEKKRDDVVLETAVKHKQDKDMEDHLGERGSDDFFQQSVNLAAQSMGHVDQTQAPSAPPRIPDEVINQLVSKVYLGIDKKGLQQFVIELKDGILGGGQISVSSSGGKVNLRFSGLDESSKTLVRNSKDELSKRLQSKNMSLAEFVVV